MSNLNNLTDDILVAYADRQLDPEEMERLKPLIESDFEALKKVQKYQNSAAQLKGFFDVEHEVQASEDIVLKINKILSKKTILGTSNVVSISDRRFGITNILRGFSASYGFQKIAASLIVGVFIGIGAYSQIDKSIDKQSIENTTISDNNITSLKDKKYQNLLSNNVGSDAKSTLISPTNVNIELILTESGVKIMPGSIISKNNLYKLSFLVPHDGLLSIKYYSGTDQSTPRLLVDKKIVQSGQRVSIPDNGTDSVIQFEFAEDIINFHAILEHEGHSYNKYYVFGVID